MDTDIVSNEIHIIVILVLFLMCSLILKHHHPSYIMKTVDQSISEKMQALNVQNPWKESWVSLSSGESRQDCKHAS